MRKLVFMAGILGLLASPCGADAHGVERSCAALLGDFSHSSFLVNRDDRTVSETLTDQAGASLDEIQKILGFRPVLKHSVHIYDEALSLLYPGTDRIFARLVFAIQKQKLSIGSLAVVPTFQHRGLATYLFKQLISRRPIDSIETHLSEDNLVAFHHALEMYKDLGLTPDELCRRAVQMTPAYRIRRNLGYGRVVSCENGIFNFEHDHFSRRYIRFTVLKD